MDTATTLESGAALAGNAAPTASGGGAAVAADLAAGSAAAAGWLPTPYRVARRIVETRDTVTLALAPQNGAERPAFTPGQSNMLYAFGVGEVPISISGDPTRGGPLLHTIRAVGAVTRALFALAPGGVVGVRGPYGRGWPVAAAEGNDLVFVAGGIGIAPLRPALYQALARRERYGKIVLLLGARTPADLLYRREFQEWRARFDLHVDVTVDSAGSDWRGNVGVVTRLIPRAAFDPAHTSAFVCGPEIMMRYAAANLVAAGVSADRVSLSLERNMKCMIGQCGHCQISALFPCTDGPVFPFARVERLLRLRET